MTTKYTIRKRQQGWQWVRIDAHQKLAAGQRVQFYDVNNNVFRDGVATGEMGGGFGTHSWKIEAGSINGVISLPNYVNFKYVYVIEHH